MKQVNQVRQAGQAEQTEQEIHVIGNCLGRRVVSGESKKGEIQWEGYAGPMYVAIQSLASRKEGQLQYIRNLRILPATFGYTID